MAVHTAVEATLAPFVQTAKQVPTPTLPSGVEGALRGIKDALGAIAGALEPIANLWQPIDDFLNKDIVFGISIMDLIDGVNSFLGWAIELISKAADVFFNPIIDSITDKLGINAIIPELSADKIFPNLNLGLPDLPTNLLDTIRGSATAWADLQRAYDTRQLPAECYDDEAEQQRCSARRQPLPSDPPLSDASRFLLGFGGFVAIFNPIAQAYGPAGGEWVDARCCGVANDWCRPVEAADGSGLYYSCALAGSDSPNTAVGRFTYSQVKGKNCAKTVVNLGAPMEHLVVYTNSWAQYRDDPATRPESCFKYAYEPSHVDPSVPTALNYAFIVIDPATWAPKFHEENDPQLIAAMNANKASNPNLKTYVSIGGWNFSQDTGVKNTAWIFPAMASNPGNRQAFASQTVAFARSHGFDGIDIDWEYPTAQDKNSFTEVLRDVRSAIEADAASDGSRPKLLLTIAAPAGPWNYVNMDLPAIHPLLDFINLMTYDFHGGSFENVVDVHTPMYACRAGAADIAAAIQHYLDEGVPGPKIIMGLGTYGRTFALDSPGPTSAVPPGTPACGSAVCPGQPGICTLEPGVLAWFELKPLLDASPGSQVVDPRLMAAYATLQDGATWAGYETAETLAMKVCVARSYGLGGMMVWDAESDDDLELIRGIRAGVDDKEGARCAGVQVRPSCV